MGARTAKNRIIFFALTAKPKKVPAHSHGEGDAWDDDNDMTMILGLGLCMTLQKCAGFGFGGAPEAAIPIGLGGVSENGFRFVLQGVFWVNGVSRSGIILSDFPGGYNVRRAGNGRDVEKFDVSDFGTGGGRA